MAGSSGAAWAAAIRSSFASPVSPFSASALARFTLATVRFGVELQGLPVGGDGLVDARCPLERLGEVEPGGGVARLAAR